MRHAGIATLGCVLTLIACFSGCKSDPTHTERGALWGGALGAGTGALIGSATGNAGAGAAIGAGLGALTGAAIGSDVDAEEAHNRALIEAQLGRSLSAGSVTMGEVISMVQAKVNDELVINHIRAHGMVSPPTGQRLDYATTVRRQSAGCRGDADVASAAAEDSHCPRRAATGGGAYVLRSVWTSPAILLSRVVIWRKESSQQRGACGCNQWT